MSKLLIAIKSEILTDLLSSSLPKHGIHICHTGSDALEQIESLHPDALLLELMLPDIDGINVLRKSVYKPHTILALTNLASPAVLQAAADAGVQGIILIPCAVRHIIERLNALIEKAPSADA